MKGKQSQFINQKANYYKDINSPPNDLWLYITPTKSPRFLFSME